jgi:cholest-4-en-3-one 26-monooxygenase
MRRTDDDSLTSHFLLHRNDHLTFGGGGTHFCRGANLARAETHAMMRQLVERLPDIRLAGPVERLHSYFVHGVKKMPVTFTPVKAS